MLKENDIEIIFWDDGSKDLTWQYLGKLDQEYTFITIGRSVKNQGRGVAVSKAFELCSGKSIYYLDTDIHRTTPYDCLKSLINPLEDEDIINGNRYHNDFKIKQRWYLRLLISWVYRLLICFIFPEMTKIKDTECGFKGFKRDVLKELISYCRENHWGFDFEILFYAKKSGYKIKEVPLVWDERYNSYQSTVYYFRDIFKQLKFFWRLRFFSKSVS